MSEDDFSSADTMGIAAVERDIGIAKDTLRVWERRYGFPEPQRDAHGERAYSKHDLTKLRLVKRLMDQGFRPGKIIPLDADTLANMLTQHSTAQASTHVNTALIELLKSHSIPDLKRHLKNLLIQQGLERFVLDTVVEMNTQVGDGWMRGELAIFEEHLYSEQIHVLLRAAIGQLDITPAPPRILLTTLPGELHTIGMLMVEAILTLNGATCIPLGAQTPIPEIQQAIRAHQVDILCLSCSASFPKTLCISSLTDLRRLTDANTAIWTGGAGAPKLLPDNEVLRLNYLTELAPALAQWRADHG